MCDVSSGRPPDPRLIRAEERATIHRRNKDDGEGAVQSIRLIWAVLPATPVHAGVHPIGRPIWAFGPAAPTWPQDQFLVTIPVIIWACAGTLPSVELGSTCLGDFCVVGDAFTGLVLQLS
jgi:hypothetical protein